MARIHSHKETAFHTDDGSELSYRVILHGLQAAMAAAQADILWMADDLTLAIWEGMLDLQSPALASTEEAVECIRQTLHRVGYGDLASHFLIAPSIQHLSLKDCIDEPPFENEADIYARVQASIRGLRLPGLRTVYVTGLPACVCAFEARHQLFPETRITPLRSRIVALVRRELRLLAWQQPLKCYLA